MGRVVQEQLKKPLANEILFGRLSHGGEVRIDLHGDELSFDYHEDAAVV